MTVNERKQLESALARAEEAEKENARWNNANCNDCPIMTWEACDEICQDKKTLIQHLADAVKGEFTVGKAQG